jgi:hypothetical protein
MPQEQISPPVSSSQEETQICFSCRSVISKKASICPHCRSKLKGDFRLTGCLVLIALMLILAIAFVGCDSDNSRNSGTGVSETSAFVISRNFITRNLKSPSSADFPLLDFSSTKIGEGEYRVTSYVDSQNGFGAMVRSNWEVTLKYNGFGDWADPRYWTLEKMIIDGEQIFP